MQICGLCEYVFDDDKKYIFLPLLINAQRFYFMITFALCVTFWTTCRTNLCRRFKQTDIIMYSRSDLLLLTICLHIILCKMLCRMTMVNKIHLKWNGSGGKKMIIKLYPKWHNLYTNQCGKCAKIYFFYCSMGLLHYRSRIFDIYLCKYSLMSETRDPLWQNTVFKWNLLFFDLM